MTAPVVTTIEPTKAKTWVAAIGSVLTFAIPLLVSVQDYLPPPWPSVLGAVLAVLTTLGVYKTPNRPADTVIVPESQVITLPPNTGYTPVPDAPPAAPPVGGYKNPWQ